MKNNDFVLKFVSGSALIQKASKLCYIYTNEPYACKHKQHKIRTFADDTFSAMSFFYHVLTFVILRICLSSFYYLIIVVIKMYSNVNIYIQCWTQDTNIASS